MRSSSTKLDLYYTALKQQEQKMYASSSNSRERDWRSALRTPPTYRVGNRTFRFNFHFAVICFAAVSLLFFFMFLNSGSSSSSDVSRFRSPTSSLWSNYNSTYPLTTPIQLSGTKTFRIGLIADLDTASRVKPTADVWRSYLKKGFLSYTVATNHVSIIWDDSEPLVFESSFSLKGRGMELSELVTFNGKMLTFDDRTGIIYELSLHDQKVIPWVILLDGDGHSAKGFKSEWATVKGETLYVGSMGKEWTTSTGDFENENPMFVKAVSTTGEVKNINWSYNYKNLRKESAGISWPGYMIHESAMWSPIHKKWFFLPRRCSNEKYNETLDEHMGCNLLITADERFAKIKTVILNNTDRTHGFSSFKFIPGSNDKVIVAIKSEEINGRTGTFITSFTTDGKVVLEEQRIPTDFKYEGFDFL